MRMTPFLQDPQRVLMTADNRVVKLFFPDNSVAPNGEYRLRGGISWPVPVGVQVEGFVILIGEHIKSGIIYIFRQHAFNSIDPIIAGMAAGAGDAERIPWPYLAEWINEVWAHYFCRHFFWNQDVDLGEHFIRQVSHSALLGRRPIFQRVSWDKSEQQAMMQVIALGSARRLIGREVEGVNKALQMYQVDTKSFFPALQALSCAIVGLDQMATARRVEE